MPREVLLEIDCQLRPEKRREFSLSSTSLKQHTGEGHRRTVIYEDQDQPNHVLWVEAWKDRKSADKFLASDDFLALQGALRTLGTISACRLIELQDLKLNLARGDPASTVGWFVLDSQTGDGPKE